MLAMRSLLTLVAAAALAATILAGCRFIVPEDGGSPQLPQPGLSGAPFPSPSLEIPPPID
jgi:hypothetical protein